MPKLHGIEEAGLSAAEAEEILAPIARDLEILHQFNRRVDRLEQSGFAKRYESEIPNVVVKMDNLAFEKNEGLQLSFSGLVESWLEDFSQDEIDAFVLSYRVFTQRNDTLSIPSLSKIYAKEWMPSSLREYFEDARHQLNGYLDGCATVRFGERRILVRTLVDVIIYGGLAHNNPRKARIFEAWEGSGVMGILWAEFFAYAREAVATLKYIRNLNQKFLEDVNTHGFTMATLPDSR